MPARGPEPRWPVRSPRGRDPASVARATVRRVGARETSHRRGQLLLRRDALRIERRGRTRSSDRRAPRQAHGRLSDSPAPRPGSAIELAVGRCLSCAPFWFRRRAYEARDRLRQSGRAPNECPPRASPHRGRSRGRRQSAPRPMASRSQTRATASRACRSGRSASLAAGSRSDHRLWTPITGRSGPHISTIVPRTCSAPISDLRDHADRGATGLDAEHEIGLVEREVAQVQAGPADASER